MASKLAKPTKSLITKPSTYKNVGGSDSPIVNAFNGIGNQISTNTSIMVRINTALQRKFFVEHTTKAALNNRLVTRIAATKKILAKKPVAVPVKKLTTQTKRDQDKKAKKVADQESSGGVQILEGLLQMFSGITSRFVGAFVATAAFKWFSDANNTRRFFNAFANFYNWFIKPLVSLTMNWTGWVMEGAGNAVGGISSIISGFKDGSISGIFNGLGEVASSIAPLSSVAFLLNPTGTLGFIWDIIKDIGSILPPKEPRGPDASDAKKATQAGQAAEAAADASKGSNIFQKGWNKITQTAGAVGDAAKKRLLEPSKKFIQPIFGKLSSLKSSLVNKLLGFLPEKSKTILKELGGAGSSKLMSKIGPKAVPIIGALANLYFAYQALSSGDPIGALLEFTSAAFDLAGLIPGGQWGPLVSLGIDTYSLLRSFFPEIEKTEQGFIRGLGLQPIMDAIKKFGSMLPGSSIKAESGRPANMDAFDPRMKTGSYFVGMLWEIFDYLPGGDFIRSFFMGELSLLRNVFGTSMVGLSGDKPNLSPSWNPEEMKKGVKDYLMSTVEKIKASLVELIPSWLRAPVEALTQVPGAIDNTITGDPTKNVFDPGKNYGMKKGEKFFFKDESGQEFHAARAEDTGNIEFYKGGIGGVGGERVAIDDGKNQGVVDAFLEARGPMLQPAAAGPVPNAGALKPTDAGQKGEIYLHWTAGAKTSTYGGYHTVITGDGKVHRKAPYSNRGRAHTAYRNSRGVGIAVASMAGPSSAYDWANPIQYESMAQEVANIAKAWGWSKNDITIKNVMTHAEAASGKDGRLSLHKPPMKGAKRSPDNYGPTMWGGDGARWDLLKLYKNDSMGSGGSKIRGMIQQRMNFGGVVRRFNKGGMLDMSPVRQLNDGEDDAHKNLIGAKEQAMNAGGVAKGIMAARNPGPPMILNNRSVLDPGLTRSSIEVTAVQRVYMPIPQPMPAAAPSGGGVAPPSPLSTFGRSNSQATKK
ncbi:hypothetical protein SWPG_00144 [Synechococcus phage S-CBM2]|nr:hypothetical protein SWPG_00144 [Synechococcus phage S-CBM2]